MKNRVIEEISAYVKRENNKTIIRETIVNILRNENSIDYNKLKKESISYLINLNEESLDNILIVKAFTSFLFSRNKTSHILEISKFGLINDYFKDKEFWVDYLIELEDYQVLYEFILKNKIIDNKYLIEKIILHFSDADFDINDIILNYLLHKEYLVKNAALIYIDEKKETGYYIHLIKFLHTEEDPDLIIYTSKILVESFNNKNIATEIESKVNQLNQIDSNYYEETILELMELIPPARRSL